MNGQQTISLPVENDRHYKSLSLEFDMLIDDFDAGGDFVPIVWVRNGNATGNQTYDWLLVRNQTNDQRVTSIYFLEGDTVLAEDTPAMWPVGQWHVEVEMDAELGDWTATFTHDGGTVNTLTRDFTSSIVPQGGQSLRLIWGWTDINEKIVYPPWGWTFSDLTVQMEPGGPFGPDAPECPGGLDWVTDTLPDGEVDVAYGPVMLSAMAGTGVYTFTAESGLPAGLSVDAGGSLSGTPTEGGDFDVTLRVEDDNAEYIDRTFALHVVGMDGDDGGSEGGDGTGGASAGSDDEGGSGEGGDSGASGVGDAGSASGATGTDTDDALPNGYGRGDEDGCGCRTSPGPGWLWLILIGAMRRSARPRTRTRSRR